MVLDIPGILQIITAGTALIAAVGTAAVLIIKELRSISAKVVAVDVKADKVAEEQGAALSVIHDNGNAHLAQMTEKLTASEARNERLILEANTRVERAFADAASRIEKLEMMLAMQTPPAPAPAPAGAIGDTEAAVQKIEIQQPEHNPVPVVEMTKKD